MDDDFIDYGELIDDAMHIIVRRALQITGEKGLQGEHHFFISFITDFPGVEMSTKLREKYPDEMTIVLQYQFEELDIREDRFSVTLSFGGVRERLTVPFSALTAFADPSVKFGLQFRSIDDNDFEDEDEEELTAEVKEFVAPEPTEEPKAKGKKAPKGKAAKGEKAGGPGNVVTLDSFRKK